MYFLYYKDNRGLLKLYILPTCEFLNTLFSLQENKNILLEVKLLDLGILSLSFLVCIWFRFLCIWRIFRVWVIKNLF